VALIPSSSTLPSSQRKDAEDAKAAEPEGVVAGGAVASVADGAAASAAALFGGEASPPSSIYGPAISAMTAGSATLILNSATGILIGETRPPI
jgi:hypothetical protein